MAELSKSPSLNTCVQEDPSSLIMPDIEISLIKEIRAKMMQLLQSKTKLQLQIESSNDAPCLINIANNYLPSLSTGIYGTYRIGYRRLSNCHKLAHLKIHCEPFKRLEFVLNAYRKLRGINMFNAIQILDIYELQQLFDDFVHIKAMHIDADNQNVYTSAFVDAEKEICHYFESGLNCISDTCFGFSASYADHTYMNADLEYEDVAFQQQCHIIHSDFLHSPIKFGIMQNETTNNKEIISGHKHRIRLVAIKKSLVAELNHINKQQ